MEVKQHIYGPGLPYKLPSCYLLALLLCISSGFDWSVAFILCLFLEQVNLFYWTFCLEIQILNHVSLNLSYLNVTLKTSKQVMDSKSLQEVKPIQITYLPK